MRILHVWPYFHEELKYHVHYLTERFAAAGHDVTILASDQVNRTWLPYVHAKRLRAGHHEYNGVRVQRVRSVLLGGKVFPLAPWTIANVLRRERPEVVHLFGFTQPFDLFTLLAAGLLARDAMVVGNDHSNPQFERSDALAKAFFGAMRLISPVLVGPILRRVFVPNVASRDYIARRFGLERTFVKVMPLGYDGRTFYLRTDCRNRERKLHIGFAGKVVAEKKIERLFQAIHDAGIGSSSCCTIVGATGSEYCQSLEAQAADLGLDVRFRPLASPEELAEFYNFIDLAVFPGSISITTLEASGCGTPVAVFRSIDGLEDRVSNGKGWLFDSTQDLAEILKNVSAMKSEGRIDNNAIARAATELAWDSIAGMYWREYAQLRQAAAEA